MNSTRILIAGGDLRQAYLADVLCCTCAVDTIGLDKIPNPPGPLPDASLAALSAPDYLVLPVPAMSDDTYLNTPFSAKRIPIDDVLDCASAQTVILGGKISGALAEKLKLRNLSFIDYMEWEPLAIKNASVTAEAAVQIAMEELPVTIEDLPVLIIGYGRIGRLLVRKFSALGASCIVAARSAAARAWSETEGAFSCDTAALIDGIERSRLIINTVPVCLLTKEILAHAREDCLLLDLASKPGGIDQAAAGAFGLRTIWALSLPGKVAPATAADILAKTIFEIDAERRNGHGTL